MSVLRVAWAVLAKDLAAEVRSREAVVSMVVFGLLTVVVFHFGFDPGPALTLELAPAILWISFAFAATLGLNRSFALEREGGALTALRLAPADRGAIYLGKMAANVVFLAALEVVVLPAFVVLYNVELVPLLPRLWPLGLLGATALSAVGTIFAAVSASTRMREVMTPLLVLPAVIPVLVAAVSGTGIVFRGEVEGYATALRLLGAFSIVFTTVSYLVFEFVVED